MIRRSLCNTIITATVLWIALYGCTRENRGIHDKDVVAKVGNATLTIGDIQQILPADILQDDSMHAITHFRDNWITNQLLVQEAERTGIASNPTVLQKLHRMKNEVLAQAMRDYVMEKADSIKISQQEAQDYFEAHKSQFTLKERYVRFRHIVTNDLDSCRMAKEALLHGVPWPEVVSRYSLDKKKVLRDAKEFYPISLAAHDLPPMNQYLHIIGNTEISPIRLIDGRYHFVQLMAQKPKGDHPDITWVLNQIQNWLRLEKEHKILSSFEQNLYLKAQANNELYVSSSFNKNGGLNPKKATPKDTLNH